MCVYLRCGHFGTQTIGSHAISEKIINSSSPDFFFSFCISLFIFPFLRLVGSVLKCTTPELVELPGLYQNCPGPQNIISAFKYQKHSSDNLFSELATEKGNADVVLVHQQFTC